MTDPDQRAADASPGGTERARFLAAAAELERRRRDVRLRLDHLEEERRAFAELRDSLVEEEKAIAGRLALARKERGRIVGRMDSMALRAMETVERIEGLRRKITLLEHRCSENTKREQDLSAQIASAREDLVAARCQIVILEEELEKGRKALARMDRRISVGGSKHRSAPTGRPDEEDRKSNPGR